VRPIGPLADPGQLAGWIRDLDTESFKVRERARREIEKLGESAIPTLRRALADRPPLELQRRLRNILAAVEPKPITASPARLRQVRAVQALESIATSDARRVLRTLAQGARESSLTREANAALRRVARR
jgi:hypothetical protein